MNRYFHSKLLSKIAFVAFLGLSSVLEADVKPAISEKVAVIEIGSSVVVKANKATVGQVFERLGIIVTFTSDNLANIILSRVMNGHKKGTIHEIVRWLVPSDNYMLAYEEQKSGNKKVLRLKQINFVSKNNAGSDMADNNSPLRKADFKSIEQQLRNAASEVNTQSENESLGITEQMRTAALVNQMQIGSQTHVNNTVSPLSQSDKSTNDMEQPTLQEQAQRSQALAVKQLQALMNAYQTVCQKNNVGGPC
jgi:hypothetical protein